MQRLKHNIIEKAFQIGFNYKKHPYSDMASVSLPCGVILDNGEVFEIVELVFIDKLYRPELFKTIEIDRIEKIIESKYTLDKNIRTQSINVQEYRNDFPFFIRTTDKHILGFNAYSTVNFTYKDNILGSEIIETVPFHKAQEESFEFIKNHSEIPIKVLCGYDIDLVKQIELSNYS